MDRITSHSRYNYYKYYDQNKISYRYRYDEHKRRIKFNQEADKIQKEYWIEKKWKEDKPKD